MKSSSTSPSLSLSSLCSKTVAFYSDQLCIRGTSVAMYDYADYNEKILGNKSIIVLYEKAIQKCEPLAMVKFTTRFPVKTFIDLDDVLREEKVDFLYCIKYGTNDGIYSRKVKTGIHCVFDMSQPHGDVYAGVSESMAKKFGKSLFVPHMITLQPSQTKENWRSMLGIPENAIVFGRFGGMDTFNVPFCWEVIRMIVETRSDIYFLLGNTPQVVTHKNIKYIPKIISDVDKNRFICTCDAHIECGTLGHSFGLNIAEFSINNKPVIAYRVPTLWNTAHLDILKDKALYYKNGEEFFQILTTFDPKKYKDVDINCYKDYTPEKVMAVFNKVFLS